MSLDLDHEIYGSTNETPVWKKHQLFDLRSMALVPKEHKIEKQYVRTILPSPKASVTR